MTYLAYNALLALVAVVGLPYYLLRARLKGQPWSSLPQRFGRLPRSFHQTGSQSIWLHAVSVGEVLSCTQLVRALKRRFPSSPVFVSTGTATGRRLADEKLSDLVDGIFYAPLDLPFAVRSVIARLKPRVVIVAETEIWPNLFRHIKRSGAGLMIVNARISDQSLSNYRRFRFLFARVLRHVDAILAQSNVDAERLVAIGAPPDRVQAEGNLKYDFEPKEAALPKDLRDLLDHVAPEPILVAGSTRENEEQPVIEAFRALADRRKQALLVLAPRHPQRFNDVAELLDESGVHYRRRSELSGNGAAELELPGVLLLDSLGELSSLYPLADLVFVGGSLNGWGGHNVLEPALSGRPVVVGPTMQNFRAITEQLLAVEGLVQVEGADRLAAQFEQLLDDPATAATIGERGRQVAQSQRGATMKAIEVADRLYSQALPRDVPSVAAYALLGLPALVWRSAARARLALYRRGWLRTWRLNTFTLCIGNLTAGGVGKTPLVAWLAQRLLERGYHVGVLTRGYGRTSNRPVTLVEPGTNPPLSKTGDEVQLLLRHFERQGVEAPVAVGADRYRAGSELERRRPLDVLIMDDGFQHLQLQRDFNVLLVDVTRPFVRADVMPLGRLRESVTGAVRADAIVLTRTDAGRSYDKLENGLRQLNPNVPIRRSRHRVVAAVEVKTGTDISPGELRGKRLLGFCGLGNPDAFRRPLSELGGASVPCLTFPDHHRYVPSDIIRILRAARQHEAEVLVTTEKDLMNLRQLAGDARTDKLMEALYWLRIEPEVDEAEELLQEIERRIGARRDGSPKRAVVAELSYSQ